MWITVDAVTKFTGLKPAQINYKDDTTGFNNTITEWILQCESLIKEYTHRNYTDNDVPPAVQNVCLRIMANMVASAILRRDTPIIRVNDWTMQTVPDDIFTDALKDDLAPFVKDESLVSDHIDIFAITGEEKVYGNR